MENQQLVSTPRQCSSTPVSFGPRFLSREQRDNNGASPTPDVAPADFYLFPPLKSALKGRRFYDANGIIKNATAELKRFPQNSFRNVSNTFTAVGRSAYLRKGTILREL
jgi:hypothetical protein